MSNYTLSLTDKNLTVFTPDMARNFTLPRTDERVSEVIRLVNLGDARTEAETIKLRELIDPAAAVVAFEGNGVEVDRFGTVRLNGVEVKGRIAAKIRDVKATIGEAGVAPWAAFLKRMRANPSQDSVAELVEWVEGSDLGIFPDGRFVAYKVVKADYTDCRTGTFDNSVGTVVAMPGGRADVDPNRRNLCSTGLHFCSKGYLTSFSYNRHDRRVMILAVDPADVVSIPADYNNTKGRAWKYEVVGEVDASDDALAKEWNLVSYDYGIDLDEEWSDFEDETEAWDNIYAEALEIDSTLDAEGESANVVAPTFFEAPTTTPAPARTPWAKGWRKFVKWLDD